MSFTQDHNPLSKPWQMWLGCDDAAESTSLYLPKMSSKHRFEPGQTVMVKVNGEVVEAVYVDWHDEYDMAIVTYRGRRLYRKVQGGAPARRDTQSAVVPSRFDVNQRFGFIETLVDMVIHGQSKAVIISGSGGLGKTYTVMQRLKLAELGDVNDAEAETADYEVIKGFSTSKALYRLFYKNRKRIVIFDDCDSVWDNPTSVSLLKAALDSYDVRRLSWLAEIKNDDDDLPQSFEFEGKVIFISNLSLDQLDQAVLSRCLYVDVSMTPEEKIQRIESIMGDMRKDMPMEHRKESLSLLSNHAGSIGDLNIRTFLKVCEMRSTNAANWKELAEYVITAI